MLKLGENQHCLFIMPFTQRATISTEHKIKNIQKKSKIKGNYKKNIRGDT